MAPRLSPPQMPLSYCFDRKGFLAIGLGRERNGRARGIAPRAPSQTHKSPMGSDAKKDVNL